MSKQKLQARTPKGFRDFLPEQMLKRNYVFDTVREVFHLYGFEPLQTPVLELRETLLGKYGEDAEGLIYNAKHVKSKEELSMRYDLTVPLARVVGEHESKLRFPFKRYQLSPVWRGDRPQKGRYREFYQCDADIVGIETMNADAEVVSVADTVLQKLGFKQYILKINNRKLLTGMGIYSGVPNDQLGDLYRSIDKFDKVGASGVEKELLERGIAGNVVTKMMALITGDISNAQSSMSDIPESVEGIQELLDMRENLLNLGVAETNFAFDFTMVRGLGYYTGPIFEGVIEEPNIGSICGGGRYDGLIGLFRKESLPTTGISLGIERIIDLMDEFRLYPDSLSGTVVQVLVTVFSEETRAEATRLASELRAGGIQTELVMENRKIGKQFNYADRKGIPVVATLGSNEVEQGIVKFKRLGDGMEITPNRSEIVGAVRELLG